MKKNTLILITFCLILIMFVWVSFIKQKKQIGIQNIKSVCLENLIVTITCKSISVIDDDQNKFVITNEQNNITINSSKTNLMWGNDIANWHNDIRDVYENKIPAMPENRIVKNPDEIQTYIEMVQNKFVKNEGDEYIPTVYKYNNSIIVAYKIIYPKLDDYFIIGPSYKVFVIGSETKKMLCVASY